MNQRKLSTPAGALFLVADKSQLHGIYWMEQSAPYAAGAHSILDLAEAQIEEYFSRKRRKFTLPLLAAGTPFQERVWGELAKIPYGETISYAELAKRVGSPKAVRAVGTANGRNPFSIAVPCHRVIASSGKLGGYAGGLAAKEKLLLLESKLAHLAVGSWA